MLDYYAIRSGQYDFLIKFCDEWESFKKLSLFPNFKFSLPMAMYFKGQETNDESLLRKADELLQDALLLFPTVLRNILDKCSVEADREVINCGYFNKNQNQPQALVHLIALYVERSHLLWKDKDLMLWLEINVKKTIELIRSDRRIIDYTERFVDVTFRLSCILMHSKLLGVRSTILMVHLEMSCDTLYSPISKMPQ